MAPGDHRRAYETATAVQPAIAGHRNITPSALTRAQTQKQPPGALGSTLWVAHTLRSSMKVATDPRVLQHSSRGERDLPPWAHLGSRPLQDRQDARVASGTRSVLPGWLTLKSKMRCPVATFRVPTPTSSFLPVTTRFPHYKCCQTPMLSSSQSSSLTGLFGPLGCVSDAQRPGFHPWEEGVEWERWNSHAHDLTPAWAPELWWVSSTGSWRHLLLIFSGSCNNT